MIRQITELLRYVFSGKNYNGTEWAESTIEKFLDGNRVSNTEFFYANRILEMKPKEHSKRY